MRTLQDMEIYPFAKKCVDSLHAAGYLEIVITNQSGIARGYFSEAELLKMNDSLRREVDVDDVYYCPHYPGGIIEKYSIVCNCRKPATGMIEQACREHAIDPGKSFLIGDRASDIEAGKNAGLKTILLRTGYGMQDEKKGLDPDYVCDDLREAVKVCGTNLSD